ncbi:TlpA family protein disulfide reductase [Rudanella paleaurantiibacter]|nr:TlpA disulfide reductase family protein [Rudanella paleaurantiibacter]
MQTRYPVLVTSGLMLGVGYLLTAYNPLKIKPVALYLLVSGCFTLIHLYGLYINFDGLKYLSPTLVVFFALAFFTGVSLKENRSATTYVALAFLILSTLYTAFSIMPRLQFNERIASGQRPFPKQFTLVQTDGKPFKLAPDQVAVINFWDSGCAYCFKKIPYVIELREQISNPRVVFVEVNTGRADSFERFKQLVAKQRFVPAINPVYDQGAALSNQLNIKGIPRQIIVKNNVVLHDLTGFNTEEAGIYMDYTRQLIEGLL